MPVPTAVPPSGELAPGASRALRSRPHAVLDLAGVAAEFLAQADRRGVLQMGAADLDDVVELLAPSRPARPAGCSSAGIRILVQRDRGGDVNGGGDDVVELCAMLTWSLGWTGVLAQPRLPPRISLARLAITSLAFMLVEVPRAGLEDVEQELLVVLALR